MENSPLLGATHSPQRSKDSTASSGNHSSSAAASSRYSVIEMEETDDHSVPGNSNLVKRPSMYHSEATASTTNSNSTLKSRRQNLLNRRSQQMLQQVDETNPISNTETGRPKFVVTNPDPSQDDKKFKQTVHGNQDLQDFVELINTKGTRLTQEEIQQLRSLGKLSALNRMSAMSNYSGVVEEVQEVQEINQNKSYIPSLVEMASTIHKRGHSSSSSGQSSSSPTRKMEKLKMEQDDEVIRRDNESIKSLESMLGVGPLPTTGAINETEGFSVRSPDLSRSIEIVPIIPPRSNRRPRSELLQTPIKIETPTKESIRNRGPSIEVPLTPTQNPGEQPLDYAAIIKKNVKDLKDRRRISSLNRPLPEIPLGHDDEDEEDIKDIKIEPDQSSENLLNQLDDAGNSIITNETKIKQELQSPLGSETDLPIVNKTNDNVDFTPKLEDTMFNENYKYSSHEFSVMSDVASYHTAHDRSVVATPKQVIITDDLSQYDNDENYEDIPLEKSASNKRAIKKLHKKKTSSSSSNKKLRPFSISTLSKLLESTDGVIIGEEFENLNISNDEKKYIEKIVDVIARLTADMVADPSRHDGTINRMKAALRILEGFEQN